MRVSEREFFRERVCVWLGWRVCVCMYALPVGRVNWHDIVSCVLVLHWSGGVWSEVKTVLLVMQMVVHAPFARSRPPTHPPTHPPTSAHIHITHCLPK